MSFQLGQDNIPNPARGGGTSVTLAATNNGQPTRITIGGQQYTVSSTITLATGGTGANGLDTGSLGVIQLWYVYAIVHQTTFIPAMVASQTGPSAGPTMPANYGTAYRLVGAFYTDSASTVGSMVTITGVAETGPMSYAGTISAVTTPPTPGAGATTTATWWRKGADLFLQFEYVQTAGGSAGSGLYKFMLPTNLLTDLTKFISNSYGGGDGATVGPAAVRTGATFLPGGIQIGNGNDHLYLFGLNDTTAAAYVGSAFGALSNTTEYYSFTAKIPIVGWNATLL